MNGEETKMRIAMFSNAYKPLNNGVVQSIALSKRGLEERGHEVYVFAPKKEGFQDEEPHIYRYPSFNLPIRVNYPLAVPFSPLVHRIFDQIPFDIVHSHHPVLLGDEAAAYARTKALPLVFTHHTLYEEYYHYFPITRELFRTLTRRKIGEYLRKCNHIIVPTKSVLERIFSYNVQAERINVIPSPIDLSLFNRSAKAKEEARIRNRSDLRLIYVGRLAHEKNLDFLLRVVRQVLNHIPYVSLTFIGDGPARPHLYQLAHSLGIESCIRFIGEVAHTDVPKHLGEAHLFVFSSKTETQGIVLVEALAMGLPIIAIFASGVKDILTSGYDSILVSEDEKQFTDAIVQVSTNSSLYAYLAENACITAQKYNVAETSAKLLEVYESVIAETQ